MLSAVIHNAVAVACDLDRDLVGYRRIRTIGALLNSKGALFEFNSVVICVKAVFLYYLNRIIRVADIGLAAGCYGCCFAINKTVAGYLDLIVCKRSAVIGLACAAGGDGNGARIDGQGAFVLCDIVVTWYELICSSIYNRICYRTFANVRYAAGCLNIRNFAQNKAVAGYCNNRTCKRIAVVGLACSFGCEGDGALSDFQGVVCRRVTVVCHRRLNGDMNFADVLYCGFGGCPIFTVCAVAECRTFCCSYLAVMGLSVVYAIITGRTYSQFVGIGNL